MRRRKYHNNPTIIDGITFDSSKEAKYYGIFKNLEEEGRISDLQLQVKFELVQSVKGFREKVKHLKKGDKVVVEQYTVQQPIYYVADFVYKDNETEGEVVVDVKSPITRKNPVYIIKKKMMRALKGIEIQEV